MTDFHFYIYSSFFPLRLHIILGKFLEIETNKNSNSSKRRWLYLYLFKLFKVSYYITFLYTL